MELAKEVAQSTCFIRKRRKLENWRRGREEEEEKQKKAMKEKERHRHFALAQVTSPCRLNVRQHESSCQLIASHSQLSFRKSGAPRLVPAKVVCYDAVVARKLQPR